ncbi:MAG: hypothetical protein JWN54_582, partial [Mycobacterium sp.]|nr:hypothetical protein [Mycobacterium sp.]
MPAQVRAKLGESLRCRRQRSVGHHDCGHDEVVTRRRGGGALPCLVDIGMKSRSRHDGHYSRAEPPRVQATTIAPIRRAPAPRNRRSATGVRRPVVGSALGVGDVTLDGST